VKKPATTGAKDTKPAAQTGKPAETKKTTPAATQGKTGKK